MKKGKIVKNTVFCDVLVIGAGSGGISASITAAKNKANVFIVEKDLLGGECPNWACVPTKILLKSAKTFYFAKNKMKNYGVYTESVTFNFKDIMKRKTDIIDTIAGDGDRIEKLLIAEKVKILKGVASFIDDKTVKIGKKIIKAKKIIIATGSSVFVPPISGLKEAGFLTFKDITLLKRLPKSLVIIGGGPVACEFAVFFQMLGVKIIIIEMAKSILIHDDAEISTIVHQQMLDLGIKIFTNTKTLLVDKHGRKKKIVFQQGTKKRETITVDNVLVATGKKANLQFLELENAGVKLDQHGYIKTDNKMQTNKKNIFAVGDVSAGMQFTHTAHREGEIAGVNVIAKTVRAMKKYDNRVVPRVIFLEYEVASVGMTSTQASKFNISIYKTPVNILARAVIDGKRAGLLKIIVDKKTKKILGGHMVGPRAGEIIHEIAIAMQFGIPIIKLNRMLYAFPTYSEVIPSLS